MNKQAKIPPSGTWTEESIRLALDALDLDKDDPALKAQMAVLATALVIYRDRNLRYQDNWKRTGLRGVLVRIRERDDRLWDRFWNLDPDTDRDPDDILDLINFAAFLVRGLAGETDRDGEWPWR